VLGLHRERKSAAASDDGRDVEENGLVSAMEEAALGIGENRRWKGVSLVVDSVQLPSTFHQWFTPTSFSSCLTAFPERSQSQFLVDSYCDNINWMCGSLHRDSLQRQHDNFWTLREQGQPPDGMPLALLFAVLSNAAFFLDEQLAWSRGLPPQQLLQSAREWFNCSVATFFRCGGLTHFSLTACQIILTLRYAFHLTGNSSLHQQLAYLGIGIARAMNLHLLGSSQGNSDEDLQRREMGRRAWWLLVEGDWDLLPYHRYCCRSKANHMPIPLGTTMNHCANELRLFWVVISPQHFNTALPDLTDEGTLASSTSEAHSLTFFLACCQSARVLNDVYGPLSANQYPTYDAVISASKKLDQIVQNLPSEVQQAADSSQNSSGPLYQWRFLVMLLAYRSYIVHRSFFVKSLSDSRYETSRIACVRAAETIISLADKGLPAVFYRLWNTTLWLVAAGLVLGVDLVHATSEQRPYPDIANRRRRLLVLVDLLDNSADRSGIGTRGASLIRHICAMEHNILAGPPSKIRLTRDDIINIVRLPSFDPPFDVLGGAGVESIDAGDWNGTPYRATVSADHPQGKDKLAPGRFSDHVADESPDIGFGIANSSLFMPQWGDRESYGTFGLPADQNQLNAFFADMLPNPSTG